MKEEEIDVLPNEYIKKFGSYIHKAREMNLITKTQHNQENLNGWYDQVKNIDRLFTHEELETIEMKKEKQRLADTSYQYELKDYMKRQPRLDLSSYNYNYEQFKEYTRIYGDAKKKDQEELRQFYKMVKYSRENKDKGDKIA